MQLFEKLILNESNALDKFDDVPQIKDLLNAGKWDEALDMCDDINEASSMNTLCKLDHKLTKDEINRINNLCSDKSVNITPTYIGSNGKKASPGSATSILFTGNDANGDWAVLEVTDTLTSEGILSDEEPTKTRLDGDKIRDRIIDRFDDIHKISNHLSDDAKVVWRKMSAQLGLNKVDNPFINFFESISHGYFDKKDMVGLNNLYAKNIIDRNWLSTTSNKGNDILFDTSLYKRVTSSNELEQLITLYKDINIDPSNNEQKKLRDSLFRQDLNKVYPYSKIIKNVENFSKENGTKKSNDTTVYLSDNVITNDRVKLNGLSNTAIDKLITKLNKQKQINDQNNKN